MKRVLEAGVLPTLVFLVGLLASPGAAAPFIAGLERAGTERNAGAVLVSELACAACHATNQSAFAAKPGPDLSSVGSRVSAAHLRRFIESPSSTKAGTTMPDVLAFLPEAQRRDAAEALTHYLATLGVPKPTKRPAAEAEKRGQLLYHTIGCVACHSPETEIPGSVPLGPLAEKYSLSGLAEFLMDPLATRPGARMPDSHLEPAEAEDLASYLLRDQQDPPALFQPDPALTEKGRGLFTEHRCNACHSTGSEAAPTALPPFKQLRAGEGCLSGKSGAWPHYPITELQLASLNAALADETKVFTPAEDIQTWLTRLNCLACHSRDGLGGIAADRNEFFKGGEESLGEQGRLPPPLTGVGAKLKAPWMRQVIATGAGVRTTMHTRMPKFGEAQAEPLVAWLKQIDTLTPATFERVQNDTKPRAHEIGRDLAGAKGLNCIACHTFRGHAAAIRGPELTTMPDRLEETWFHRFLEQPQRFAPLTVMPGFWPDGKSILPDVLGGDPGMQRDAIWQYLAQGPEAREPEGLVLAPLLVEVKDEAVIVRRAFPGIGKRGLGVGYPGGINLAFDAAQMRLASIWRGGFIEASGLWRGQGSGQARLLGKEVVNFPPGPAFAILASPDAVWPVLDTTPRISPYSFKGYTLDAQQRPTLRYALDGFLVEDFFIERPGPAGTRFLERTLKFPSAPPAGMYFRVAVEKIIEASGANDFGVGRNLLVRLPIAPHFRDAGEQKELLLPVRGDELKLEYHLTAKP